MVHESAVTGKLELPSGELLASHESRGGGPAVISGGRRGRQIGLTVGVDCMCLRADLKSTVERRVAAPGPRVHTSEPRSCLGSGARSGRRNTGRRGASGAARGPRRVYGSTICGYQSVQVPVNAGAVMLTAVQDPQPTYVKGACV